MLCWSGWVGESKSEKKARKETGVTLFLDAIFRGTSSDSQSLADGYNLEQSGLTTIHKCKPKLEGQEARERLELGLKDLTERIQNSSFLANFKKHAKLRDAETQQAIAELADEIKSRGHEFTSQNWTGGGKGNTVTYQYTYLRMTPKGENFVPIVSLFASGYNTQNEIVMVSFTNDVVSNLINTYGGNELGVGTDAASSTTLTNTTANKRPK